MPSKTPTERALAVLRGHGYQATITERWNPHAKIRQDLFGFCDVLSVAPGETLAVQATSSGNVASRVNKLTGQGEWADSDVALRVWDCLRAGWRIEVWGFRPAPDRHGSTLKARTLVLGEDGLVIDVLRCSLAVEGVQHVPQFGGRP